MKDKERAKQNQVNEEDIVAGYVRLVEALIFDAFEKISVPLEWGKKRKLSQRTIDKKKLDVENIAKWLGSPGSDFWIGLYESACALNRGRTKKTFEEELGKSRKRLEELSTTPS